MPESHKKVLFKHLRLHTGHHNATCAKRWFDEGGLDFKVFVKEGYTQEVMFDSCKNDTKRLEELRVLVNFIEENNLWE